MCRASEKTDERVKTMNQEEVSAVEKKKSKNSKKENSMPNRECWYCDKKTCTQEGSMPSMGKKVSQVWRNEPFCKKMQKQIKET